jgi:Protein ENHANCED DISEASE RESISTANCE 2, C-terminal
VQGASKHMTIDLGITIQGDTPDELPERILCQARFSDVDFDSAQSVL